MHPREGGTVFEADGITERLVEGDRFGLAFLTGLPRPGRPPAEAARSVFADLAVVLSDRGILPIQEKVYGRAGHREEILSLRREAYGAKGLDAGALPATFHQGKAGDALPFRGVQLWGVVPRGPEVAVATVPEGRLWTGDGFRILSCPGIRGTTEDGALAAGAPEQARRMFLAADAALAARGFAFTRVARTWIYIDRLLDWYGTFNEVRNAFFAQRGVGAGPGAAFPASTGIQGVTDGEECSMDLLAVDGPGVETVPLTSSNRQGSAAEYGSSFARAMSLKVGGHEFVFVSGTASIDPSGASVHLGDPRAQIRETRRCIADLLEDRGAGLEDIHLATLFGKTPEVLSAYREVVPSGTPADFPVVPVVADVCRDELLVEIEALAVVPQPGGSAP